MLSDKILGVTSQYLNHRVTWLSFLERKKRSKAKKIKKKKRKEKVREKILKNKQRRRRKSIPHVHLECVATHSSNEV